MSQIEANTNQIWVQNKSKQIWEDLGSNALDLGSNKSNWSHFQYWVVLQWGWLWLPVLTHQVVQQLSEEPPFISVTHHWLHRC